MAQLPKIDLIIGGSPCQGFSFAGKQFNFDDERSKLFFEFVRILDQVRETNPDALFMLENVVMKKEYQDVITQYLGVQPILINSSLVSAQNRKRLYWTNIPNVTQPEDKGILVRDILLSDGLGVHICGRKINPETGLREDKNKDLPYTQMTYVKEDGKTGCLTTVSKDQMILDLDKARLSDDAIAYMDGLRNGRARWEHHKYPLEGKASCLTASHAKGVPYTAIKELLRHLLPIEAERLQTVPDNYTSIISKTQRLKALGNGWTVDVIAHIFSNIK